MSSRWKWSTPRSTHSCGSISARSNRPAMPRWQRPSSRGSRKMVCCDGAVASKVQITLGIAAEFAGRFHLLYATFLLAAMLLWSVAFLHRERTLKVVGAVGALASFASIAAVIVGHIALGTGAAFGIGALLSA